jgi:energy-coupling factor transporter ATP-binding protein EcfA2
MAYRAFIDGPNFSGRSQTLLKMLGRPPFAGTSFFLGPYAEAALSGLSSTLADEIEIYRSNRGAPRRPPFPAADFTAFMNRTPQTLSGGEQVLLALHCFSLSSHGAIAVDTALEQLDRTNRAITLDYLSGGGNERSFDVALIDNRIDDIDPLWTALTQRAGSDEYACDLSQLANVLIPHTAPSITLHEIDFSYRGGKTIFCGASATLEPGKAHRLVGPNGAGKTTLLKILVGVLAPSRGRLTLDLKAYQPWLGGQRPFAIATQNPDHQWCGATLREDVSRRRSALATQSKDLIPPEARMSALAHALGIRSLDVHLYELPLAARKRLSWLWSFSGAAPWIMLDEPTIGQDRKTRADLAGVMRRLCELGYGIIFVTHDEDFAARVPHRVLVIENQKINDT